MKLDALKATYPERGKSVVLLQISERPFHGTAATVEVTEPLSVARDAQTRNDARTGAGLNACIGVSACCG